MATTIRLKQIESSSVLISSSDLSANFSESVMAAVIIGLVGVLPAGVISGSSQLDGTTIKHLTISPNNSDEYSLIISGAVAIVDATNLPDGGFGDVDSTVPGQIWVNGMQGSGSAVPIDPSEYGQPIANIIDQGEW